MDGFAFCLGNDWTRPVLAASLPLGGAASPNKKALCCTTTILLLKPWLILENLVSLILQFYFVLGLPKLNLCWREQICCVQSYDHVFNATLLMVDGNLKFKPNDIWYLLSFWYRVQILLLKYKINMKFLTWRSKEKVLFLFLYILVSLHPGIDPFILEGVWPLYPSWWPFALYKSHPVQTSWEIMMVEIACELTQNFRTYDGFS